MMFTSLPPPGCDTDNIFLILNREYIAFLHNISIFILKLL
ncbi:hypothetical protein X975_11125, partial [Stegodyphus mimosarum]